MTMKRDSQKMQGAKRPKRIVNLLCLCIFLGIVGGIKETTDTAIYAATTNLQTTLNESLATKEKRQEKTTTFIKNNSGISTVLKQKYINAFTETTTEEQIKSNEHEDPRTSPIPGPEYSILFSMDNGIFQTPIDGSGDAVLKIDQLKHSYFDYDPISQQIFYTNLGQLIIKSSLNGTNQRAIADIPGGTTVVVVDWLEQKVFVNDHQTRMIGIINLKKLTQDQIRTNVVNDISLDIFHSVVYWSEYMDPVSYIFRSNYNGENRRMIYRNSQRYPLYYCFIKLVVDYRHDYIYFECSSIIYKMKSDGSEKRALFAVTVNIQAIAIKGDDLFMADYTFIRRVNKHNVFNQTILYKGDGFIVDLQPVSIRSDNDYGYDDLICPKIARCFGIDNIWTCLHSEMICDEKPQCYGELDEFYCCYDKLYNCSSVNEIHLVCSRSAEEVGFSHDSLDFVGWKSSSFYYLFGSTFLSFRCSLQIKYLDVNSLEKNVNISHIQRHHILRQFIGPTVFRNLENSDKLILTGHIPNIKKDAFKTFHRLNKLVLQRTNIERFGEYSHFPINLHNDSITFNFENLRTSVVYKDALFGLHNLQHLIISENRLLSTIEKNAFNGLENLHVLEIAKNRNLSVIHVDALKRLLNLRVLFISENSEKWRTNDYIFKDFTALRNITLSRTVLNKLTFSGNIPSLRKGDFYTDTINELVVRNTNIKHLSEYFFSGIENMKILSIAENPFLSTIDSNAFNGITFLTDLSIINNPILIRLSRIFMDSSNGNSIMLNISGNNLAILEDGLFENITHLEAIDLRKNNLLLKSNIFQRNKELAYIYSDSYSFCCPKPCVIFNKNCYAPEDDISSCNELIADRRLFVLLWGIGMIAFFGNISVLLYRFIKDKKSLKQTFVVLVINLGCSDAAMGLYMLIIAFHDSLYEGEYVWHDYDWKQSLMCKMSGTLAFISSESSVIFIGLITIDRFLAVKYPIGGKRISLRQVYILSIFAWVISIVLALIPVLMYPQFYSYSGTCLALPLTGKFNQGWHFSVAVYLGFNCILFVLITIGQICILKTIIQSARRAGSKHSSNEREAAMFLLMVAFTDALCWFPVGITVIMALSGKTISKGIYAWIIIFVLPVNSAINPFLYTFVPLCRKKQKELRLAKVQEPAANLNRVVKNLKD